MCDLNRRICATGGAYRAHTAPIERLTPRIISTDFNLFAKKLLTETGECVKLSTNGSKHNQQEADMGNSVIESISPKAFAARHRVAVEKVYKWIEAGELRAINTSTSTDIRPRYSILMSDVEKFEEQRASGAVSE